MAKSLYKSDEAKANIKALYNRKRSALTIDTTDVWVETPFGRTHLLVTGPENAPPLVLIHGLHAGAPVALEPLQTLAKAFRIYAPDTMGQAGFSEGAPLSPADDSYGRWLLATIGALGLQKPDCVSVSFGAYVLLNALRTDAKNLGRAVFVVPSGFVNSGTLTDMAQTFYRLARYKMRSTDENLRAFLGTFATAPDDHMLALQEQLLNGLNMDYRRPPALKPEQIRDIANEIFLITAEHDVFFPSKPSVAKAKACFTNFREAVELAGQKHIPGPETYGEICRLISGWLG
jgi:pimeloyl-ACP methyl ester carboxylesterase